MEYDWHTVGWMAEMTGCLFPPCHNGTIQWRTGNTMVSRYLEQYGIAAE